MFKNKLVKALAAAAWAVVGVGVTGTVNSSNTTVQASTFHYLRRDHKPVTLGYGEKLPLLIYKNGKRIYANDDPKSTANYTDENDIDTLKTQGWKYINGTKYYKIYKYFNDANVYIAAKYFTKKYNDMSYLTVYLVNHKIKALADDMQNTDDGMWYGKGDIILVNNFSRWNHDKYVDTISPMQDGKHNKDGWYSPQESGIGGELKPSDFRKYCSKAGKNVRYQINDEDYYTNSSLARGGMYHKGHFYRVYSRQLFSNLEPSNV